MIGQPELVGTRLAALRVRRGLSQVGLAQAAGVSVAVVRKLEQGQRRSARLETLALLADALDVLGELLGAPSTGGSPARGGSPEDELSSLRRTVLGIKPDTDPPPGPTATADERTGLWRLYWTGNYPALAAALPSTVPRARLAVVSTNGSARRAASLVLADLLHLTASLVAHRGQPDLAHLALHGARRAAEAAEDELLHTGLQATRSWVLSRQGLWAEAEHVAVTAAAQVEPVLSRASTDRVAVWGELLRYAAVALSRGGRHTEAADMLGLMTVAGMRLPGDQASQYPGIPFGPTVAAMREVDAATSAGDPRRALRLTRHVIDPRRAPAIMHARYLLNVARAQTLDARPADAVATLLRAERIAPAVLTDGELAGTLVAELLARRRAQRLPGLLSLARRAGFRP